MPKKVAVDFVLVVQSTRTGNTTHDRGTVYVEDIHNEAEIEEQVNQWAACDPAIKNGAFEMVGYYHNHTPASVTLPGYDLVGDETLAIVDDPGY